MPKGLFLVMLLLVASTGGAHAAEAIGSEFFIGITKDGVETYTYTSEVPLAANEVCYYWRVQLDRKTGAIAFTETFTLPAAPTTFGEVEGEVDPALTLEQDGMVAIRTLTGDLDDGWFGNGWCISEGDPLGPHSISVSMQGKTVGTFDFTVVEPGAVTTPEAEPEPEVTEEVQPETAEPATEDIIPETDAGTPPASGGKDKRARK